MVDFYSTEQSVNWIVKRCIACLELNTAVNKPQPYHTVAYLRSLNLFVNVLFEPYMFLLGKNGYSSES